MATQLGLYNRALSKIGDRGLHPSIGLTEDRPARYALDDNYTGPPTLTDFCLSQGLWRFAKRTVSISSSGTPSPGFSYAFARPSDFIRTIGIWTDASRNMPLREYEAEGTVWSANIDPIIVSYVSNHATLGGGLLSAWPPDFAEYAATVLARMAAPRIKAESLDAMMKEEERCLAVALAHSAMEGPKQSAPTGSWVRARQGGTFEPRATGWSTS